MWYQNCDQAWNPPLCKTTLSYVRWNEFSRGEQLFNTAKKMRTDYCNEFTSLILISTFVPEHVTVY